MLKFALVGCGRIAQKHAEVLKSLSRNEATLVAVCDINQKKAVELGRETQVPSFAHYSDMLSQVDIDVIAVLVESGKHFEVVMDLAKHKKHIIVEKPIALRPEHGRAMIDAVQKTGKNIYIVKQNRFNKPVRLLKDDITNNNLGDIFLGSTRVRWCRTQSYYDQDAWRGTWKYDGGALTNQAIHHIDLLTHIMGKPRCLHAFSATAGSKIEVEDTLVANILFETGALGNVEVTTATRPIDLEGSLSILGSKGTFEIGGFAVNKLIRRDLNENKFEKYNLNDFSENPPNVYGFGHSEFYKSVIKNLVYQQPSFMKPEESLLSLEVVHAIYSSIETGKTVNFSDKQTSSKLGL